MFEIVKGGMESIEQKEKEQDLKNTDQAHFKTQVQNSKYDK